MKKTLAILLALALLGAFAACGKEIPAETTAETTAEPDTVAVIETTTEEATETTEETTEEAPREVDPLQLFNDATKMVKDLKPGYSKSRYTKITDLDFGALGRFQIVKDAVYGFFDVESNGEGTLKTTVNKGQSSDQMRASKWTAGDVKSATAEPDGEGGYVVTLFIKEGNTRWSGTGGSDPGSGSVRNSPIDRGPLCYGEDNDGRYDHKTAKNIYLSINNADGANAKTEDIGESSRGIKVVANIDAEGRLQKLYGYMEMRVDVYHVTYLIVTLTNKYGAGYGELTYSDFIY